MRRRLFWVIVFITILTGNVFSQERAQYSRELLTTRLERITKAFNIHLIYDANSIAGRYAPAFGAGTADIMALLNSSVSEAGLRARQQKGNTYILLPNPFGKLKGQIIDATNAEPVANVSVTMGSYYTVSDEKGRFEATLPPGNYNALFSHVGYEKKTVWGISITPGAAISLDLSLRPAKPALAEVKKNATLTGETIASHYVRRKAAATITDGVSAEQILASPDIYVGDVLKRVNGVSSVGNKSIGIRGMSERYNEALIDGVPMPGISINQRKFSFDIFPKEMIGSIVISKTALPDKAAEFSGGQVAINTLSIPNAAFTRITVGAGTNLQNTGQDFYRLGKIPVSSFWGLTNRTATPPDLHEVRNNLLPEEALKPLRYKAAPNYNAGFALGRAYALNERLNLGLVAGISLRENQDRILTGNIRRTQLMPWNEMPDPEEAPGAIYRFSSGVGSILNIGLQGRRFNSSFKNIYTTFFEDNYHEAYRIYEDSSRRRFKDIFQEPVYSRLRQHKIEARYDINRFLNAEAFGAVTYIRQTISDQRKFRYFGTQEGMDTEYDRPNILRSGAQHTEYDLRKTDSRVWLQKDETVYNIGAAVSARLVHRPSLSVLLKTGYNGLFKSAVLSSLHIFPAIIDQSYDIRGTYDVLFARSYVPAGPDKKPYYTDYKNGLAYSGRSDDNAFYLLADNTFFKKLRLAGGLRAEYLGFNTRGLVNPFATSIEGWLLKPSANLRYAVTPEMNIRAAYFKTRLLPDFREASDFAIFDYELDAEIRGQQFTLTTVDNFDLRYEWFPAIDELISVSGFYKRLKRPVELLTTGEMGYLYYVSQVGGRNKGIEIEIRKSMAFLSKKGFIPKLYFTGNATANWSEVKEVYSQNPNQQIKWPNRPLFNQVPWVVNAGLVYSGDTWGMGAWYNRSGPKMFIVNNNPNFIEYENGVNLLDAQLYINLLKNKGQLVLNVNNLLNPVRLYYINAKAFKTDSRTYSLVNGTMRYEKDKGDQVTFSTRSGTVLNASFTYKF
ncbi:TonB-dependent receptor [Niabella sp.]|uniref:TonB-dependent receptor n=1 Tax=Niabella sp. TaxID=1962976 RepID=UPI0026361170|nr:TonB-dependent receptor [Niabella sp.]